MRHILPTPPHLPSFTASTRTAHTMDACMIQHAVTAHLMRENTVGLYGCGLHRLWLEILYCLRCMMWSSQRRPVCAECTGPAAQGSVGGAPCATALSEVIAKSRASEVFPRCAPPQNSTELAAFSLLSGSATSASTALPTATTLTGSGYACTTPGTWFGHPACHRETHPATKSW